MKKIISAILTGAIMLTLCQGVCVHAAVSADIYSGGVRVDAEARKEKRAFEIRQYLKKEQEAREKEKAAREAEEARREEEQREEARRKEEQREESQRQEEQREEAQRKEEQREEAQRKEEQRKEEQREEERRQEEQREEERRQEEQREEAQREEERRQEARRQEEQRQAKRRELVEFALQFEGNPYVYGGTSLTDGADCSGFVLSVFQNFGYELPRVAAAQCDSSIKKTVDALEPGDLIFYGDYYVDHVAIYIGDGMVIHASSSASGIKISRYDYRIPLAVGTYLE